MEFRSTRPTDYVALHALIAAAFGQEDEAQLVARLRAIGCVAVERVAVEDGALVGHVVLSWFVSPARWLCLAPVSVSPGWQRRGVGSALVKGSLAAGRDAGGEAVVVGNPNFYRRFGFSVAAAAGFDTPYPSKFTGILALAPETEAGQQRLIYPAEFEGH